MKRFNNFDYFRLFLALEVVTGHFHMVTRYADTWWPLNPVPAFVCLSGFLIPGSFGDSKNWQHFAWKRVLRVYPAFVASLILLAALNGIGSIGPALIYYVTMGAASVATLNIPLWSLMLEECLYASHVVARLRSLWSPSFALVGFVLFMSLAMYQEDDYAAWSMWVSGRAARAAAAYFAGNLLYFNRERLKSLSPYAILPVLIGAIYLQGRLSFASWMLPPVMDLVAVLAVLAVWRLPQIKFRIPDLSYGLYIYHVPILWALLRHGVPAVTAYYVGLALVVGTAAASWYLLESKALKWKDRPWKLSPEPRVVEVAA